MIQKNGRIHRTDQILISNQESWYVDHQWTGPSPDPPEYVERHDRVPASSRLMRDKPAYGYAVARAQNQTKPLSKSRISIPTCSNNAPGPEKDVFKDEPADTPNIRAIEDNICEDNVCLNHGSRMDVTHYIPCQYPLSIATFASGLSLGNAAKDEDLTALLSPMLLSA